MRRNYAVFCGNTRVSLHWTLEEAEGAKTDGQHVRYWDYGTSRWTNTRRSIWKFN